MFNDRFSGLEIHGTRFYSWHFRAGFFNQHLAGFAVRSFNGDYCFHVFSISCYNLKCSWTSHAHAAGEGNFSSLLWSKGNGFNTIAWKPFNNS